MDNFTDTEVEALPQTSTILKEPNLVMDEHNWQQQGYTIIDQCCNGLAISIPYGKMLIKENGRYDLVDELR